jgi:hypothetical protein
MRDLRTEYTITVLKPEGKTPLGIHRGSWENNIKTFLKEIGCQNVDLIHLPQFGVQWQTLVNTLLNLRVT